MQIVDFFYGQVAQLFLWRVAPAPLAVSYRGQIAFLVVKSHMYLRLSTSSTGLLQAMWDGERACVQIGRLRAKALLTVAVPRAVSSISVNTYVPT